MNSATVRGPRDLRSAMNRRLHQDRSSFFDDLENVRRVLFLLILLTDFGVTQSLVVDHMRCVDDERRSRGEGERTVFGLVLAPGKRGSFS